MDQDIVDIQLTDKMLCIVLPGYRGPYAPHDFTDLDVRAADKAVSAYLTRHITRLPWRQGHELVFQLAIHEPDPTKEATTIDAYRDLFRYQAGTRWRHFTDQIPLTVALAVLGLCMLWTSHYLGGLKQLEESLRKTLSDTAQVGAWVALWTAIAGIFSVGFTSLQQYYALLRLARAKMGFRYSTKGTQLEDC